MLASACSAPPAVKASSHLVRRFSHTCGAWLRSPDSLSPPPIQLMNSSRFAGMQLDVLTYAELPVIPFWRYDLIVLEQANSQTISAMLVSIKRVRALSKAPLVMLTGRVAPEVTIAGLRAGADAVASILASEQVLLAHWGAMLKRWKAV